MSWEDTKHGYMPPDEHAGYVGGQTPGGPDRFGDEGGDWDGDMAPAREMGRDGFSGSEFAYLGHFRGSGVLCSGHNEIPDTTGMNPQQPAQSDAAGTNKFLEQLYGTQAPGAAGPTPGGSPL